jgi:hypothetical protein
MAEPILTAVVSFRGGGCLSCCCWPVVGEAARAAAQQKPMSRPLQACRQWSYSIIISCEGCVVSVSTAPSQGCGRWTVSNCQAALQLALQHLEEGRGWGGGCPPRLSFTRRQAIPPSQPAAAAAAPAATASKELLLDGPAHPLSPPPPLHRCAVGKDCCTPPLVKFTHTLCVGFHLLAFGRQPGRCCSILRSGPARCPHAAACDFHVCCPAADGVHPCPQ